LNDYIIEAPRKTHCNFVTTHLHYLPQSETFRQSAAKRDYGHWPP